MRRFTLRRARLKLAVAALTGVFALASGTSFGATSRRPPPQPPKKPPPTKPSCKTPVDRRHPCQQPRW